MQFDIIQKSFKLGLISKLCKTSYNNNSDNFNNFKNNEALCYRKHPTRQFYKISVLGGMVSWKIVCVLTKFRENSPGNFYLFLWYFFLLENRMCSCGILRKLSWKFWCVLATFCLSWKIYMCSYATFGSPRKFDVFL